MLKRLEIFLVAVKGYGLFLLITLISSCGNVETEDPEPYNQQIKSAYLKKESWVQTPESIIRQLFPKPVEGFYEIRTTSFTTPKATISLKLSPLDDEVISQTTSFQFEKTEQVWQIRQIRKTQKRRD